MWVFRKSSFQKQMGNVTNCKGNCKQQQQQTEQHKETQEGLFEEEDSRSISCVTVETESNNMEWMATSYEVQENYKIKTMGKYVHSDKRLLK